MGRVYGSNIEDFEACMATTIDKLAENPTVDRIVLAENRENEYDFKQTQLLIEIANAYKKIVNEDKLMDLSNLGPKGCERFYPKRLADLQFLIMQVLRKDPIGAYVRLNRIITRERASMASARDMKTRECYNFYIERALTPIKNILESTKLIKTAIPRLKGHRPGDRKIYREVFRPIIRPNFMLTRYMIMPPKAGRLLEKYSIGNTIVEIFKIPGQVRNKYFIVPPEFRLSEEKYTILDEARRYLAEHRPTDRETSEPEHAREIFTNIGRDLVKNIIIRMGITLSTAEIDELAIILARYTAGFGVLELVLSDEKIQDVYINSPIGTMPMYVYHSDFEECETNLIPTKPDSGSIPDARWTRRTRCSIQNSRFRAAERVWQLSHVRCRLKGWRSRYGGTASDRGRSHCF
jgi:hypothetical protein